MHELITTRQPDKEGGKEKIVIRKLPDQTPLDTNGRIDPKLGPKEEGRHWCLSRGHRNEPCRLRRAHVLW